MTETVTRSIPEHIADRCDDANSPLAYEILSILIGEEDVDEMTDVDCCIERDPCGPAIDAQFTTICIDISDAEDMPQNAIHLLRRGDRIVMAEVSYPNYADDEADGHLCRISAEMTPVAVRERMNALLAGEVVAALGLSVNAAMRTNDFLAGTQSKWWEPRVVMSAEETEQLTTSVRAMLARAVSSAQQTEIQKLSQEA